MGTNKITFTAMSQEAYEYIQKPIPASHAIPQWWKDIPKYAGSDSLTIGPGANLTVKQCPPMIDTFTSGYILTAWADMLVTQENGFPFITWTASDRILETWPDSQVDMFEVPEGFNRTVFKFVHKWIVQTPPGWSTLFTQPFAYMDSPTRAIAGIVDTDVLKTGINCPFVVKEGFEGIIKKGTPLVQLIPIKRANWEAEFVKPESDSIYITELKKLTTEIYGYYAKRRFRKSYK